MMNYTLWMEQNLPGFQNATSAYTAALVKRVKRTYRAWILIARISLLGLALILTESFHTWIELPTLQSSASVMYFGGASLIGVMLGYVAEYLIVTSRIRKLVETSALSDIAP